MSYFNTLLTFVLLLVFLLFWWVPVDLTLLAPGHLLSHHRSPRQLIQTSLDTPATHTISPVTVYQSHQHCAANMRCKNVHRHSHQFGFVSQKTTGLWAQLCVYVCLCACVCLWGNGWRLSFISRCDQVFYMIRYDDTGPIKGWGCVENVMTGQEKE